MGILSLLSALKQEATGENTKARVDWKVGQRGALHGQGWVQGAPSNDTLVLGLGIVGFSVGLFKGETDRLNSSQPSEVVFFRMH